MTKKKTTPYLKVKASSKRIILRPYKLTDFSNLKKANEARLSDQSKFDEPIPTANSKNYAEFKGRIERHRKNGKSKVHYIFGIFGKRSGEYIGQIDFLTINEQLCWANLGYQIQNTHWAKGYASESCKLALKVAFRDLGYHRVEAATELDNKAAIGVAKKIGMDYEGKRKKFFPDNGGIDMVVYGANSIDYK